MTHTPGPWTIDDTGPHEFEEGHVELNIWGPDGAYFGAIAAIRNDYSGDMDSNARLIAAAPELLEALREIAYGSYQFVDNHAELVRRIGLAQKAIAKTEER